MNIPLGIEDIFNKSLRMAALTAGTISATAIHSWLKDAFAVLLFRCFFSCAFVLVFLYFTLVFSAECLNPVRTGFIRQIKHAFHVQQISFNHQRRIQLSHTRLSSTYASHLQHSVQYNRQAQPARQSARQPQFTIHIDNI